MFNDKNNIMKTRKHFETKLTELKTELKNEIKSLLDTLGYSDVYAYDEDKINTVNVETEVEEQAEINSISKEFGFYAINFKNEEHCPIEVDDIEDVHDLMLVHFLVKSEVEENELAQ